MWTPDVERGDTNHAFCKAQCTGKAYLNSTDRHTWGSTDRHTWLHRQTHLGLHRQTYLNSTDRHTWGSTDRHTWGSRDRHTLSSTYRHTWSNTDRQTHLGLHRDIPGALQKDTPGSPWWDPTLLLMSAQHPTCSRAKAWFPGEWSHFCFSDLYAGQWLIANKNSLLLVRYL
jgi:hypothetical protein